MYFQVINPDCLEAFIVWSDSKNRGTWNKSLDIDPTQPSKVLRKDLNSTEEKRKLKPSEDCQIMYLKSNEKAKNVSKYLKRQFNRHVKELYCLLSAILVQISHHTTRYTADVLRKQTAYYLSKHWELFSNTCDAITDEPLESYIKNLFYGHSYGDILCLEVIGYMWKLKITVVNPDLEELKIFHTSDNPHIVLVFNNLDGLGAHYCATVGISKKWVPVKGRDHSYEIRKVSNIRKHAKDAEMHYHEVKRLELKSEYDFLLSEMELAVDHCLELRGNIDLMETQLCDMGNQLQSMMTKAELLKGKLLLARVHADDFSKRKTLDISQLQPAYINKITMQVTPFMQNPSIARVTQVTTQVLQITMSTTSDITPIMQDPSIARATQVTTQVPQVTMSTTSDTKSQMFHLLSSTLLQVQYQQQL